MLNKEKNVDPTSKSGNDAKPIVMRSYCEAAERPTKLKTVTNMLKDNDKMPWGLHAGKAMINVPAQYLLWLLDNNKCSGDVKKYIEENKEALKKENKK